MNKVLVITYYWPPAGGPGVQRVLKFVKHLPEYGWEPCVLTVRDGEYPSLDPSLAAEVPDSCTVERTAALEPGPFYRRLAGMRASEPIPVSVLARPGGNWRQRLSDWIRLNLFVPDAKIGWVPYGVRAGRRVIARERPAVLLSSSPPATVHLIAHRLARASGLPWVADYRDPWTRIFHYTAVQRTAWAAGRDRRLERRTVAAADVRVTINPIVAEQLAGDEAPGWFRLVPNGYDEDDFPDDPGLTPYEHFTVCYAGNLTTQQNPARLWPALASLAATDRTFAGNFRFVHLGVMEPAIRRAIEEAGLLGSCDLRGYVPHAEAINAMRRSHVLLLVIPDAPGNEAIVTGKIFEYLAAGNFVLGVGPLQGAAAQILRECSAGIMRPHATNLDEVLGERYRSWQRDERWEMDKSAVSRYTRRRLTGELAAILTEAVDRGTKRARPLRRDFPDLLKAGATRPRRPAGHAGDEGARP
jgi:glycosyltransferase involved in cell wall biosynthesis